MSRNEIIFYSVLAIFICSELTSYIGVMSYMYKKGKSKTIMVWSHEFWKHLMRYRDLTYEESGQIGVYYWLAFLPMLLLPVLILLVVFLPIPFPSIRGK